MTTYKNLFSPLKVGSIYLRNRVVAAPITKYVYEQAPAESLEIIASKARGGAGLVILGSVSVNDAEAVIVEGFSSSLYGPKKSKYQEELSIIHQYGAKASVELHHCGYFAGLYHSGIQPVGPTTQPISMKTFQGYQGIMPPRKNEPPRPDVVKMAVGMDEARMQMVIQDYVRSALTAQEMGFDMIMLHFAHGWVVIKNIIKPRKA